MVSVLLQVDVSYESINSEAQEKDDGKCEFYNSLERSRLRPISFVSISAVFPLEKSIHSFVGESAILRWTIGNFRKYLWVS